MSCIATIILAVATLKCDGPRPTPTEGASVLASLTPWTPVLKQAPTPPRRRVPAPAPAPPQVIQVVVHVEERPTQWRMVVPIRRKK